MGEQTWPTEEEMAHASLGDINEGRNRRVVSSKIISAESGMSSYQADWLVDEEGNPIEEGDEDENEEEEGDDNEDEDDMEEQKESSNTFMPPPLGLPKGFLGQSRPIKDELGSEFGDENDDITLDGSILTVNMPTKKELQQKRKEESDENERFPDEIDTPEDIAARVRFARYRALQSFRTSPWHPKENLPTDYSQVYQFENFQSTQRR
jgi:pre-rRNA-processing protein TSR1